MTTTQAPHRVIATLTGIALLAAAACSSSPDTPTSTSDIDASPAAELPTAPESSSETITTVTIATDADTPEDATVSPVTTTAVVDPDESAVYAMSLTLTRLPTGTSELDDDGSEIGAVTIGWHVDPPDASCLASIEAELSGDVVTGREVNDDSSSRLHWRSEPNEALIATVRCERGTLVADASGPISRTHLTVAGDDEEITAAVEGQTGAEPVADANEPETEATKGPKDLATDPELWPDPETGAFPTHNINAFRNGAWWPYPHPAWRDFGHWCYERAGLHPDAQYAGWAALQCSAYLIGLALGLHESAGADPNCAVDMYRRAAIRAVPLEGDVVPAGASHGEPWSWADCPTTLWPEIAQPANVSLTELCRAAARQRVEVPSDATVGQIGGCDAGGRGSRCTHAARWARLRLPEEEQRGTWIGC